MNREHASERNSSESCCIVRVRVEQKLSKYGVSYGEEEDDNSSDEDKFDDDPPSQLQG